jgi:cytidine deaminase
MKHFEEGNPKPELIIALAGPVGTDLAAVVETVSEILRAYRYTSIPIKVSDLISVFCNAEVRKLIKTAKADKRIDYLMDAGDALRASVKSGSALVPLICSQIRSLRREYLEKFGYLEDKEKLELYNHCFIINSLKHPSEVEALRGIYKEKIIVISAFSGLDKRIENLCSLIAKSEGSTQNSDFSDRASSLINKDSKRPGSDIGQNLSNTFHLADFFVRVGPDLHKKLDTFLKSVFSYPYITPFRDEFFMYEASANALRSADLSRQVGAVITNPNHDIVARGCNEVPTAGGGAYWPDRPENIDNRDFRKGRDFNAIKKDQVLMEFLTFLRKNDLLNGDDNETNVSDIVRELVFGRFKNQFKNLRVSNLIEFGGVVHAEMFALSEAARRGLSVQRGSLYCTTFPCHMCARHIIAAGIERVIYIEPYPKSMTQELFPDVVAVDEDVSIKERNKIDIEKVYFDPFEGVAPRIYSRIYTAPIRKNKDGYTLNWDKSSAQPKVCGLSQSHLDLELPVAKQVESLPEVKIDNLRLTEGTGDGDHQRKNS